jgi:CHAT domain-containing protein
VSAEMMVEFYKNVLEGQTYSSSLRNAKLKLLEKNTTANPHFWAPFLLIGR